VAATIDSPQALFEQQLKTMLWVERKLSDEVLPELRQLVHSPDLKAAVSRHLEETKAHVRNLERVFGLINVKPGAEESEGFKGLRREHDEGVKGLAADDSILSDAFHAGSIAKSEHAEIAAYTELIEIARQLGESSVAGILRDNLDEEERALETAENAQRSLLAQLAHA
jgi:ferritin-like metal-binding protein YciE